MKTENQINDTAEKCGVDNFDLFDEMIYVSGPEGNSIYINDRRVAGPKPWGGGKVLKQWKVRRSDLMEAMSVLDCQTEDRGSA